MNNNEKEISENMNGDDANQNKVVESETEKNINNIKYDRATFGSIFKTELYNSIARDKKHLLRFLLICFMSFLYGIICITGVWDPVANISKVPMAIVNRDNATCVAYVNTKGGTEFIDNAVKVGYLQAKNSEECNGQASKWYQSEAFDPNKYELNYRYASLIDSVITNNNKYDENSRALTTSIGDITPTIKYLKEDETNFTPNSKYWVQLKIPTNYTLNTYKLMRGLAQIGEPNFTDDDENDFFKTMDYFSSNKMEFWATYEHSFMIGNMMSMLQVGFGSLATSILTTLAPETMFWLSSRQDHGESSNDGGSSRFGEYYIIPKNIYNFIMEVVKNIKNYDCDGTKADCPGVKPGQPSNLYKALQHLKEKNPVLYESVNKMFNHIKNDVLVSINIGITINLKMEQILPFAFQIMFPDLGNPNDDPRWEQRVYFSEYKTKLLSVTQYFLNNMSRSTSVDRHIQGYEFGTYGYGLGLYFISISLWIGAITQTFIYRKKSYTPNAKWYQHYFSKWFTMLITSYAQTLLLFLGLLAVGYGKLGSPIVYMLMWMIVTATVLTTITQALWYSMPDDNVGRFLCIIYTVFNLTAGGGSFPVILQNGFFQAISYIVPFKYTIFGMSNIVYGIASNEGIISMYNTEILGCFGALMIFLVVFLGIGLGTAYIYRRIEMFGTFSLKEIYETMDSIDATKDFVRSRRVINNLSVEYSLLIKQYIDEKHREQKIKNLEDKINSLYKDPSIVRIKKLEAISDVYRNRFEVIKQKYVVLVQKAEITNDAKDIRKSQKLKTKLEALGEKITVARKEIEMLKRNPNYVRIAALNERYEELKDQYMFISRTVNEHSSKLKLKKVYTLRQELTYLQKKIDELNSNTMRTVFDNPHDKKINKLIVQYNLEKEQLNHLKETKPEAKLIPIYQEKLLFLANNIKELEANKTQVNRHIEERIMKLKRQLEELNAEKNKNYKLSKITKDESYNIKIRKINNKIMDINHEIGNLENELRVIVEQQKDKITNKFKFAKYNAELIKLKTNYIYDDNREGID